MRAIALLLLAVGLIACDRPARAPGPAQPNPLEDLPIDATRKISAEQALSWAYRRELAADLNGDRSPETVVLASDVTLGANGRPIREDGHRWALVVREGNEATLLYAAFVPHGFAEAAVLSQGSDGTREVLVQERTPATLKSLALRYEGPGRGRSRSAAHYAIESWLPGGATLPD